MPINHARGWSSLHFPHPLLLSLVERSITQPPSLGVTASTFSQALSALEMLTRLCVESGWRWIDGMLLAGCLAYGLGNFNDALGWYSRILEVDSKSVAFSPPSFSTRGPTAPSKRTDELSLPVTWKPSRIWRPRSFR